MATMKIDSRQFTSHLHAWCNNDTTDSTWI